MRTFQKSILASLVLVLSAYFATAQTADEIIANYFENTGGKENWEKLEGVMMQAKVNQNGLEIPIDLVNLKDGRQFTHVKFQGMSIKQGVFDGTNLWSTNFQSMKAEKSDAESTANFKLNTNDFPDPFLNYKEKGYTVELMGKETIDGAETFKVKLTKEPITIDGEKVDDVTFYFFDTENFVPIAQESEVKRGQNKGQIQLITMSDYQEVDGLYFPFSMTQGAKGGQSAPIVIEKIILNPEVKDEEFAFPEDQ
ncbi:MAG: outer membrane lipoprotein-sorting protein [Bacteroidota bacterium]